MSKARLIELLKMNDYDLEYAIFDFILPDDGIREFRKLIFNALKDVEQDTKNGCALKIHTDQPGEHGPLLNMAQCSCLNYQDKDLAGL